MKAFNDFYIENFSFDIVTGKANFEYSFDKEIHFSEEVFFYDEHFNQVQELSEDTISSFLFHISIALGISYYKLFPTKNIIVESGFLDIEAKDFWQKFYTLGLGEFFFRNNISPVGLANFTSDSEKLHQKISFTPAEKAIVPVWGGKDSIVTIKKVQSVWTKMDLFTFGKDNPIYHDMEKISGENRLFVKRTLSPNLFILNETWYYNGHVPITGIISFILTFVSYLYGYKYIIFSNEYSANFWNIDDFWGIEVNHQYSKSLEFENDFREYVAKYINDDIVYFSMMRPYYEVNILKQFSVHAKEYFPFFTSCNRNFHLMETAPREKRWCLECPKCAFTFACLHPFLTSEEMNLIFGGDMYADTKNIALFRELAWVSGHKPFECVGTNEEILWSMKKSAQRYQQDQIPLVLKDIQQEALFRLNEDVWNNLDTKLFHIYEHNIPLSFLKA